MKVKKIAVTGGIGSGKSEVLRIIKNLGLKVFSCDEINRELLTKRRVLKHVKVLFPTTVRGVFRLKLDKKALSDMVFSDKSALNDLNGLLHPMIMEELIKKLDAVKDGLVFAEVPLLFEEGYQDLFDNVIVVKRNIEARIGGVMKRSNLSREEVIKRINNQIDYDKFDFSGLIVIINDKDIKALEEETEKIVKSVLGE